MSSGLREVTDPQRLAELRTFVQSLALINDPYVAWALYRAQETVENQESRDVYYYYVEIVGNQQFVLRGIIAWPIRQFYPEVQSLLALVQFKIDAELAAFNAGHHWRYKGV